MFTAVFAKSSRRNHHAQLCLSGILQPIQSECYAKAGHLPDWFYKQVCSYAENADPSWREQAIQELVQFLGPPCTRTGSRLTFNPSLRDGFFRRGYVCFKAAARLQATRPTSAAPTAGSWASCLTATRWFRIRMPSSSPTSCWARASPTRPPVLYR